VSVQGVAGVKEVNLIIKSYNIILYYLYIIMTTNVLKNKYVFYTILVIAVANLLGYLAMADYESLILFVSIYALSTYFSKKTILNVSVAILGTALLRQTLRKEWSWYEREGLKNKEAFVPADEGEEKDDDLEASKIDFDKGLETQLKELKGIIGEKGAKYMSKDAAGLKIRQGELMDQMQMMAPMMENAKDLIKSLESSGIMKLVDKFLPMVESAALPGMSSNK
jgi:hypothetical protein